MPFDLPARVLHHRRLNTEHFLLTLEAPPIARSAHAGQFVMIQVRPGRDPLLRRPMSICRTRPGRRGTIEIMYKVVGEGTRYLSRQPPGVFLPTLGPLGRPFRIPSRSRGKRSPGPRPVLIAGGIGIAIFPFLAEVLAGARHRPQLLFGARSRADLVGRALFRGTGVPIKVATEDGSAGARGFVTRLLEPLLGRPSRSAAPRLYACGPTPMLRAVGAMAIEAGVPCQLALEAHMPCGIGVCLGCVVRCPADDGGPVYRRVCTEGPVFEAGEVIL